MAKLKKLQLSNEKRVYLTKYFAKSIDEGEDVWITIKKLPYSVKKKLELLSLNTFSSRLGAEMVKKAQANGYDIEGLSEIKGKDAVNLMVDLKLSKDEADEMTDITDHIARLVIENGVDPKKHNIEGENGEKIGLDYEFFEDYGTEKMNDFIINEIKDLSKGFFLGE